MAKKDKLPKVSRFKVPPKLKQLLDEINLADNNINAVWQAAETLANRTLLFKAARVEITPLRNLVSDLSTVLSFIRRDVLVKLPSWEAEAAFAGLPKAQAEEEPPDWISSDRHESLCPLTVFLRLVAQAFSKVHFMALTGQSGDWGKLGPLRQILVRLQTQIRPTSVDPESKDRAFYPGLTPCLMFYEENSQFTVCGSSPRYKNLDGLDYLGRSVRFEHLKRLKRAVPNHVLRRIEEMEKNSAGLCTHFQDEQRKKRAEEAGRGQQSEQGQPSKKDRQGQGTKEEEEADGQEPKPQPWENPFRSEEKRATLGGYGAAFQPDAQYKLACLLDCWRFQMERPRQAHEQESQAIISVESRGLSTNTSCAEWELWVTYVSGSPPEPWRGINPPPRRENMPRAGTWGTTPKRPPPVHKPRSDSCQTLARGRTDPNRAPLQRPSYPPRDPTSAFAGSGSPHAAVDGQMPVQMPSQAHFGQYPQRYGGSVPQTAHPYAGHAGAGSHVRPGMGGRLPPGKNSVSSMELRMDEKPQKKSRSCCGF